MLIGIGAHVTMYECIYVSMFRRAYVVYVLISVYILFACIYVCTSMWLYGYMFYMSTGVYVYLCICMCVCTCA